MTTTVEKRETFTPGPWKIKNGKNYYHIHGDQEVALVENWMNETPRANARLIAAAPLAKVRAALAKVEGGGA